MTRIQIAQYVHDLMEQFLNPNLALEKELEELLKEAKYRKDNPIESSPYETYSKRKDKSETAITFFNRKYKRL
jgi:cell division septum initiation protein DivIVA